MNQITLPHKLKQHLEMLLKHLVALAVLFLHVTIWIVSLALYSPVVLPLELYHLLKKKWGNIYYKSLINTDFENEVVAALKNKAKLNDIRQIIANSGAQQFESLFRCLYDNVEEYTTNIGEAIIIISQYQYEYSWFI